MARMDVKVQGAEAVLAALGSFGKEIEQALAAGLFQEGEEIMARSKQIVSVDTGTLRSTGHVEEPEKQGGRITVTMGYGGPAAPYAAIVHERVEVRHNPPTQAKYLEQPAREAERGMAGRLAARVRSALK